MAPHSRVPRSAVSVVSTVSRKEGTVATQLSVVAIIPLYNGERYIAETMDSVLTQTVKPAEIIVVDDGSSDGGAAIVEKYADRGVQLLRKENGGQGSARNHGVAHSTADVICFLDQDDRWYPNHVQALLK